MQSPEQLQFVSLVESHRSLIYTIVNRYCQDVNYRDDLYQDILTRAWKSYHAFRGDCPFKYWICRIATCTAIDRLRRLKENVISVANDNIFYSIVDEPYTEMQLPLINHLSPTDQRTFNFILEGLSYSEISIITNEPENRIRVRMHRIKKQLSKSIKH
jgi:RNA polymerase sigma factor (sigma-70 family)